MSAWGSVRSANDQALGKAKSVSPGGLGGAGQNAYDQISEGKYGALAADIGKGYSTMGMGGTISKAFGWDNSKQKKAMKKAEADRQAQNQETRGYLDNMSANDYTRYSQVDQLASEAQDQATNAKAVYSNDIQPRLKSIMEEAQRQAGSAMSLEEAGNVNNKIQTDVRALYDQQGQTARKQGLADSGVLAAMGAQATQNTMGNGGVMTGAQTQLLAQNNQQQAGLAYARAQQEMDRLREQGLNQGFAQSAAQYDRGQNAIDRYQGSVGNYEQGMNNDIDRQRGFRGEINGLQGQSYGIKQGGELRDIGYSDMVHSGNRELFNQQIAMANADNAAKAQMVGAGGQIVGGILGGIYGGPGGAQAGSQAGGQLGMAPAGQGQAPAMQQSAARPTQYGTAQPYQQNSPYGQNPYAQQQNPYGPRYGYA